MRSAARAAGSRDELWASVAVACARGSRGWGVERRVAEWATMWSCEVPAGSSVTTRPLRRTKMRSASRSTSGRSRRRDQHRDAAAAQRGDERVDLLARADVDAAGRLVEEEEARRPLEPLAEHDLLLVAARQRRAPASRRGRGCAARRCARARMALARDVAARRAASGSARFSATVRASTRPAPLRSSGTSAKPAAMAARGEPSSTRAPSTRHVAR